MKICACTVLSESIVGMSERKVKELVSRSPADTANIARAMAKMLRPGDVIYLYGELGSGKTVFAKAVCAALGVHEAVTSPSFVIATEYEGAMKVAHIDLYRLTDASVRTLPIEEYMAESGVTLVEWADRIEVGEQGIKVKFTISDHEQRRIKIEDFRY
jgi:tRNA threonylcarbamoyladenosine biosynthesis protein TsaE